MLCVVVWGVIYNFQYSLDSASKLLSPPAINLNPSTIFILFIPLVVMVFGNFYCGWLCPFGALQELSNKIIPPSFRLNPDKKIWRITRFFKFVLLFIIAVLFINDISARALTNEPLIYFFDFTDNNRAIILTALLFTIPSLFIERFWCRNLCLSGSIMSLLGRVNILRRILPTKIWYKLYPIKPGNCPVGIVSAKDNDCINCDVCKYSQSTSPAREISNRVFITLSIIVLLLYAYTLFQL